MNVKTLFIGLVSAWIACTMGVFGADDGWAPVANQVSFRVRGKGVTAPVTVIGNVESMTAAGELFKTKDSDTVKVEGGKSEWCVINVPVEVCAAGRERKTKKLAPAHYVRKLHVDVYLLIRKPVTSLKEGVAPREVGTENFYLLKKGMDLVDIPMKKASLKEGSRELGQATFNVGIFIPRSTAYILTDDFADPIAALKKPDVVAGYAVEASFNGEKCREFVPSKGKGDLVPGCTPSSKLFDKNLFGRFGEGAWWVTRSKNNFDVPDADLLCISETPFAMYYGRYYPRTQPTYGTPEDSDKGDTGDADEADEESASGSGTKGSSTSRRNTSHRESESEKKSDYDSAL